MNLSRRMIIVRIFNDNMDLRSLQTTFLTHYYTSHGLTMLTAQHLARSVYADQQDMSDVNTGTGPEK